MNPSGPLPDSPPAQSSAASPASVEALQQEYQGLQNLFLVTLGALIVLSLGVGFFTFVQIRLVRAQLSEQQANVARVVADYQKVSEPVIRKFASAIQQFASTNRDFQPILEKYRPVLSNYLGPSAGPAGLQRTSPATGAPSAAPVQPPQK